MPVNQGQQQITNQTNAATATQTAIVSATATATGAEGDIVAASAPSTALFGGPLAGFFYPRFSWIAQGSLHQIEFVDPVVEIRVAPGVLRGQNIALSGATETLFVRAEFQLLLTFQVIQTDIMDRCFLWFYEHAVRGGQTQIILDRFNTCQGQWEYERFNNFFDKAEVLNNPIMPVRTVRSRPLYSYQFSFRQGS